MSAADLYVFAYGSLMWDPGFRFVERRRGLLRGYHRAFCIYSHHYRGTPQNPGLVLGLAPGGACRGIVYRVAPADDKEVRAYLWEREIGNDGVYVEKHLPVLLDGDDGSEGPVSERLKELPSFTGAGMLKVADGATLATVTLKVPDGDVALSLSFTVIVTS